MKPVAPACPSATVAFIAGLALAAAPAFAQGLGEAARRAQEQRNASDPSRVEATKLTGLPDAAVLQEVPLTVDVVQQYATARAAVTDWLWRNQDVLGRFNERVRRITRLRDLASVYDSEPHVKATLAFHGFNSEFFIRLALTLDRARARAQKAEPPHATMPEVQASNTRFVAANYLLFQPLYERWAWSNNWLPLGPSNTPY